MEKTETTKDMELERATCAAAKRLQAVGRIDEVSEQRPGWIIGMGCDGLVIARVGYAYDGLPEETEDRLEFERVAAGYIAEHGEDLEDCKILFDAVDLHIMGGRALLRHVTNCL